MIPYYVIDAFIDDACKGNPAGVCLLQDRLPSSIMQHIAAENNLSETAFVCPVGQSYELRWFTPKFEIDLCGHATLAAAFAIANFTDCTSSVLRFETRSGNLSVACAGETYRMTFPARKPTACRLSEEQIRCLGCSPTQVWESRDLIVMLDTPEQVRDYVPDYGKLARLNRWLGIVLTARGIDDTDFVSRYFCPKLNLEDPVTGSSHCSLAPLWAEKLSKKRLIARQLSQRGGKLDCSVTRDQTVELSGQARLYLKGEIFV